MGSPHRHLRHNLGDPMPKPKGPDPVAMTDDKGTYFVYVGKTCKIEGCGVDLTSRNRHNLALLCLTHGRHAEKIRSGRRNKRLPAPPTTPATTPTTTPRTGPPPTYRALTAHSLLDRFLCNPMQKELLDQLHASLVEMSLQAHFRNVPEIQES